jgi:small subunit ribosomal protein S6
MQRYETVFIVTPAAPEDEVETIVTGYEGLIGESEGTLHKTERWGRKKLAYTIQKQREGNYTLFLYDTEPTVVQELERRMRMNDRVLRFLTVRADEAALPSQEEKDALASSRAETRRRAEERAVRRREAEKLAVEAGEDFSVEEWERQADEEERRARMAARAAEAEAQSAAAAAKARETMAAEKAAAEAARAAAAGAAGAAAESEAPAEGAGESAEEAPAETETPTESGDEKKED